MKGKVEVNPENSYSIDPEELDKLIKNKGIVQYIEKVETATKDKPIDYNKINEYKYGDKWNMNMLQYFTYTMEYQMLDTNDYTYLLYRKDNSEIPTEMLREFIDNFVLQRDLNTYFSDLLNNIYYNGVLKAFFDNSNAGFMSEINKIEKSMFKTEEEALKGERYYLYDLYTDYFKNNLKIVDPEDQTKMIECNLMIKRDTISLDNYTSYTEQLKRICAYFKELIEHKISLYGFDLKEKEVAMTNKDGSINVNIFNEINFDVFEEKEHIFKYYEIKYLAYSKKFNNVIFTCDRALYLSQNKYVKPNDSPSVVEENPTSTNNIKMGGEPNDKEASDTTDNKIYRNELLEMFEEVMDFWLDMNICRDSNSLYTKDKSEIIPLYSNIKKHVVMDYVKRYKIPLKIKKETVDRYLEQTFLKKYKTEDYIYLNYKEGIENEFRDVRRLQQTRPFKITGFSLKDYTKHWANPYDTTARRYVTQSMRIYIQDNIVGEYFNLNALTKVGVLYDYFPLHNVPEMKILKLRYAGMMDSVFNKDFYHSLSDDELDDINNYFGQYVAVYFNFIDGILDNFKNWSWVMFIVAIFDLTTQTLQIFNIERNISFFVHAVVQCVAIFVVINYSISNYACYKVKQEKLNIKWGRMSSFKNRERERTDFEGDVSHNLVNGFIMTVPKVTCVNQFLFLLSWTLLVLAVVGIVGLVYALGLLKTFLLSYFNKAQYPYIYYTVAFMVGFILGTQIKIANIFYSKLAKTTTAWENYKLESEYENSLFIKVFIFRFANAYFSLLKTTIVSEFEKKCTSFNVTLDFLGHNESYDYYDCWYDNSISLIMIFITLQIWNWIEYCFCHKIDYSKVQAEGNSVVDDQMIFEKRESLGKDYIDLIIENGFVMLFGATNSIIFILMNFNMQTMINTDLVHLCTLTKRPTPRMAISIGIFEYLYLFMMVASIVVNALLLAYTSKAIDVFNIFYNDSLFTTNADGNIEKTFTSYNYITFYGTHWVVIFYVLALFVYYWKDEEEIELHMERNKYIEKVLSIKKKKD